MTVELTFENFFQGGFGAILVGWCLQVRHVNAVYVRCRGVMASRHGVGE